MSKKIGRLAIPIFFVFWGLMSAKGQKHEIGLGVGALNYSGDLARIPDVAMTRPGIQGFYRYNASPVVSLRAALMFGLLAGKDNTNDPIGQARQAEFSATINQLSGTFEYNFFDYGFNSTGRKRNNRITPYFSAGLSFFNFEYNKIKTSDNVDARYPFQFAIPFGLGLKYRIKSRLNFNAEFTANKTFTDYLDGVSNSPTHPSVTTTKYLSNPLTSDWFYYLGVSLSYTFYKIHCPD